MSRRVKVTVSVLVVVLLLTLSGTAVVMADEPTPGTPSGIGGLLARVASILGITQDKLVAAFQQACQEMRAERQATDNCSATANGTSRHEWANRFREKFAEKQQKWLEMSQQWLEKKQRLMEKRQKWLESKGMGRWFEGDVTDNQTNMPLSISPAMRGTQMVTVAR